MSIETPLNKSNKVKPSNIQLEKDLRSKYRFDHIIGNDPALLKILEVVAHVADTDATVLILGEHGTGKELIAKALHMNSSIQNEPFITVNCAALPANLIESELFGHVRSAFTGASMTKDKRGKFELANNGTIFLDEIGELPLEIQVKLLRVLQNSTYSPVGSEHEKVCNVRVIAATNRNMNQMLHDETFREDLYYRLNVIEITLPALRDRKGDIKLLIDHFIKKYYRGKKFPEISKEAERILANYEYPGNIRQLENAIYRALILGNGFSIEAQHLPELMSKTGTLSNVSHEHNLTFQEKKQYVVAEFEKNELISILKATGGRVRKGAEQAGMDIKNFSEKLKKYNIQAKDFVE